MVKSLGGAPDRILLVGCEPEDVGSDEEGKMGLSEPVAEAVDEAASLVGRLVAQFCAGETMEAAAQMR